MILTGVVCLIVGLGIGYLIGLWHQSKEEVFLDKNRLADAELIGSVRWQLKEELEEIEFSKNLRSMNENEVVIHNVSMTSIMRQVGDKAERPEINADRVYFKAVFLDKETGKISSVILPRINGYKTIHTIIRKAGIRVLTMNK